MIIIEPLPLYSSSDPSPDYTAVAGVREVTVEAAWHSELPGVEIRTRGTRNIVRSYKSKMVAFSVVFQHQQADAGQVPAYCQDAAVTGFIRIHDARASKITCISISLEGEVELGLAGKSPRSFTNTTFDLWTADDVHSVPPNIHNFTIPFPQTIEGRNKVERALPSSIKLSTRAGLAAEIRYAFTVRVTVQTFRGMTRKIHRLGTQLMFTWRCSPLQPPPVFDRYFSRIIDAPRESWAKMTMDVPLQDSTDTLRCILAVPVSRIFCISDPLRIHVQVFGPSPTLQNLLTTNHHHAAAGSSAKPRIELTVTLRRFMGISGADNARLRPIPLSSPAELQLVYGDTDAGWIAWNGALVPEIPDCWAPEPLKIHGLNVVDSVVLNVRTAIGQRERFDPLPRSMALPVKLVTDRFPRIEIY